MSPAPILELHDLQTEFVTGDGVVRAVDGVSYTVAPGETLGIVGESGCGKSVGALSILRLIPSPPGRIVGGSVLYRGEDLLTVTEQRIRAVRGNEISMIFQEPMTSLNPMMSVGAQICEPLVRHLGLSRRSALERAAELLDLVHIPDVRRWLSGYPHEMSGGMRQRVMIAMALACEPQVLIADEPTTALDVTIQAQILLLINELQDKLGMAVVLITHDLGVVAQNARRVVVMYAGRKVEEAPVEDLFEAPLHPYTRGLMRAVPHLESIRHSTVAERLTEIPGVVPALHDLPDGCAFADRCALVSERCRRERPTLEERAPGHLVACWDASAAA